MKKLIAALIGLAVLGTGAYFAGKKLLPSKSTRVTIVMNTPATDISPYALNLNNLTRVQNIYEGLVAFDRNLRFVPALALSWGNKTDTLWEFRLRRGVSFHDGTFFTAQDFVDSYERAKNSNNAQIETYLKTIQDVRISGPDRIEIQTFAPDPLLLSKLTKLFVFKEGNVGTGPYRLEEWDQGNEFVLSRFDNYWGQAPEFEEVSYKVMTSKIDRQNDYDEGKIDILVSVPEDQALVLPEEEIRTGYGLEVNFLMFKLDDGIFAEREMREAVASLINPETVEVIGNHFVRRSNQFIAPGVFGYNQDIPFPEYDPDDEARDLFGNRLQPLDFDYLSSYRTLSEYLAGQLKKAGFSVKTNPAEPDELLDKIAKNESQFFLIGWRAEDGDAGSFFDAFIHSDGPFNGGRYSNPEIDALIEESRTEMEPQERLTLLQQISEKLNEDFIGIPLFEPSRLYAVRTGIDWEPRLDGLVLASEVKSK